MSTDRSASAAASGRSRPVAGLTDPVSPYLTLKPGSGGRKGVDRDIFVDVNGLGMLP